MQMYRWELRPSAESAVQAGVDLEYGVRAWCALERCYLPSAPHKDERIVAMLPLLGNLESAALEHQKAVICEEDAEWRQ